MAYESMLLGCIQCGHRHEELIDRAHRDEWMTCPACGEQSMRRMLAAPNVRTRTSASFIDGTKRFTGIKEMEKLKRERSRLKLTNDKESLKKVKQEINKLGGNE